MIFLLLVIIAFVILGLIYNALPWDEWGGLKGIGVMLLFGIIAAGVLMLIAQVCGLL